MKKSSNIAKILAPRKLLKNALYLPEYLLKNTQYEVVVFLHIPKCAGTTISEIAKKNYNPWRIFDYYVRGGRITSRGEPISFENERCEDMITIRNYLQLNQSNIDLILGHIPYGIHRYIDRPCLYFTLIREPVSRVWSQFNIIANHQSHYLHPIFKKYNYDLIKILRSEEVLECSNDQSRMLLGTKQKQLAIGDLDRVIEHIENNVYYIGYVEEFQRSMIELQKKFGWKYIATKKQNVGSYPNRSKTPSEDLVEVIREYNMLDLAVYDRVVRRSRYNQS